MPSRSNSINALAPVLASHLHSLFILRIWNNQITQPSLFINSVLQLILEAALLFSIFVFYSRQNSAFAHLVFNSLTLRCAEICTKQDLFACFFCAAYINIM
jgi:hypothetical protein